MAAPGRLGKTLSMPDVSSPVGEPRENQLSPLPDVPFISPSTQSANANYNIDDDAWADRADPVTGSVFYIEPSIPSRTSLVPSSSSSSLSSSPSVSEFAAASSPTTSAPPFPERLQQLPVPESPLSAEEYGSVSPSFHWEKKRPSLRVKLQKMVGASAMRKKLGGKHQRYSESMSDLTRSEFQSTFPSDMTLQIPEGAQFGSHGTPLHVGHKVKVELDLSRYKLGMEGGVPCSLERLGIVPVRSLGKGKFGSLVSLRFSFKTQYPPPPPSTQPVVIRGVLPGKPAAETQLKSGDTIIAVNQHHVNIDNIDSVLATLSNKIHFVIKKGHRGHSHMVPDPSSPISAAAAALLSPPPPHSPRMGSSGGLVRLVAGGRKGVGGAGGEAKRRWRHLHMLVYITLDVKEDDPPEKDILFQYPRVISEDEGGGGRLEQLLKLRGVFLTLSDTLASMTGSWSSCNSSILLDGQLVHLSCCQKDKELLLVALPADLISQYQLQLFLESVVGVVRLLYQSVQSAFTTSCHLSSMEHMLGVMFDMVLSDSSPPSPSSALLGLPALPKLTLTRDVHVNLDVMLSGLESADHSNRTQILPLRRPFLLTGSCLIYKGALACSHLSPPDQRAVATYCYAYRLLELTATESVSQIVIWKEVFPSSAEGTESDGKRTFLLIVGMEQMLLCMVMRTTAVHASGACSHNGSVPSMDAVYVDLGRSLLLGLRAQDLFSQYDSPSTIPSLISADITLTSAFRRSSQQFLGFSPNRTQLSSRSARNSFSEKRPSLSVDGGGGEGSESEEEVDMGGIRKGWRSQSMLHLKQSFRQRRESQQQLTVSSKLFAAEVASKKNIKKPRPPYTLTSGQDNLLLHYLNFEPGCGLMLCPTHSHSPPGPVQSELLKCFQQTCCVVRGVLRGCEGAEVSDSESEDDWNDSEEEGEGEEPKKEVPRPFSPKASSVVEHGVLLECSTQSLRTTAELHYWVIGRYYRELDRELYVCCQENSSQSTIEMAFKLLFGWPG